MSTYPTINRSLLLVVPKQPFYDWSNALTPDLRQIEPSDIKDYNSYILEDELFLDNPKKELKNYWKDIFINELYGQWTKEDDYPTLNWELFTEWFNFYKSSIVLDLSGDPLYIEQYD